MSQYSPLNASYSVSDVAPPVSLLLNPIGIDKNQVVRWRDSSVTPALGVNASASMTHSAPNSPLDKARNTVKIVINQPFQGSILGVPALLNNQAIIEYRMNDNATPDQNAGFREMVLSLLQEIQVTAMIDSGEFVW